MSRLESFSGTNQSYTAVVDCLQTTYYCYKRFHTKSMADRKRITALKALEWLQNIQEYDSGAESNIASDTDGCNLHEDNLNNLNFFCITVTLPGRLRLSRSAYSSTASFNVHDCGNTLEFF